MGAGVMVTKLLTLPDGRLVELPTADVLHPIRTEALIAGIAGSEAQHSPLPSR